MNCDRSSDECAAYPCQNGGTCQEGPEGYTCACPPGYTGRNCTSPISRCQHNPCHNGATCHERNNRYVCACVPGYGGRNCQFLLPDHAAQTAGPIPWTAVASGILLVVLLLAGCALVVGCIRSKVQQRREREGEMAPGETETINNLTNNCQRDKDVPVVSVVGSTPVKNTNKKVDYHSELDDMVAEKSSYKSRHAQADYNLVHEVKYESKHEVKLEYTGKEAAAAAASAAASCEDMCQSLDCYDSASEYEEKRSKRLQR